MLERQVVLCIAIGSVEFVILRLCLFVLMLLPCDLLNYGPWWRHLRVFWGVVHFYFCWLLVYGFGFALYCLGFGIWFAGGVI